MKLPGGGVSEAAGGWVLWPLREAVAGEGAQVPGMPHVPVGVCNKTNQNQGGKVCPVMSLHFVSLPKLRTVPAVPETKHLKSHLYFLTAGNEGCIWKMDHWPPHNFSNLHVRSDPTTLIGSPTLLFGCLLSQQPPSSLALQRDDVIPGNVAHSHVTPWAGLDQ